MAVNYGIAHCKKAIENLERLEDDMFEKLGHGFDKYSQENMNLVEYKRLLKKFTHEKENGLLPSYDSVIHGGFE